MTDTIMEEERFQNIGSAVDWLTRNAFEWYLEVNPQNGTYESIESYVNYQQLGSLGIIGDPDVSTWENAFYIQVYPCTAISCYMMIGSDMLHVLGAAILAVERHSGWEPEHQRDDDFQGGPKLSKHKKEV